MCVCMAHDPALSVVRRLQSLLQRILKDAFLAAHESGLKVYDSMPEKYTYPEGASHAQEYVIAKHSGVYVAKDWYDRVLC